MGDRASIADAGAERPPIDACVLLAGAIKPSPLVELTGFSTLDLLVGADVTLLDAWGRRLLEIGIDPASVIAVHGANVPSPSATPGTIAVRIRREKDHLRGPAGAARDAMEDLAGRSAVLIAEAKRHPGPSLAPLVQAWHGGTADVVVGRNPDGEPAGLYVARVSLLALVPGKGFMDLKEQWLGKAIDSGARVSVVDLPNPGTRPVRLLPQYLRLALDEPGFSGFATGVIVPGDRRRALVSSGAQVDASADLVDSVVMEGATVGADALVVRSLVAPGARVEPGAQVVDAVVTGSGVRSDKMPVATAGYKQGWRSA